MLILAAFFTLPIVCSEPRVRYEDFYRRAYGGDQHGMNYQNIMEQRLEALGRWADYSMEYLERCAAERKGYGNR